MTAGAGRGSAAEEKKVNVYNWDTYIGETTLDTFKKATGISVQYDLFADNEELFAKLKDAKAKMPPEYVNNPAVFAPADVLAKCEALLSVGEHTRLYDEAWTKLQAS